MSMQKQSTCRRVLRAVYSACQCCIVAVVAQLRCKTHWQAYNGFNLVVGDLATSEVAYVSNRGGQAPTLLQPGVHGISNGQLHSKWPKVRRGLPRYVLPIPHQCTAPVVAVQAGMKGGP